MYVATVESKGKGGRLGESDFLSYTLCVKIAGVVGGIVGKPGLPGKPWRLVAFWCEHTGRVKPGYGARNDERRALADFNITAKG